MFDVDGSDLMTKFCPKCGEKLVDEAKFCKNCGADITGVAPPTPVGQNPESEPKHTLGIVLGYIFAIIIPLIGLIISIYLLTRRESQRATRHGKYILIISVAWWAISLFTLMLR